MNKRLVKVMRRVLAKSKSKKKSFEEVVDDVFPVVKQVRQEFHVVYVFCGCAKELQTWQQFNPDKVGFYIVGVEDLKPLHNANVEYCGTWFLRTDSAEIQKEIDRINWENATDD